MVEKSFSIPEFEVYFDYLCPFVYNASLWLRNVEEALNEPLPVVWRYFSLEQVNSTLKEGQRVWDPDLGMETKGIKAFRASEAVRKQGEDTFLSFHRLLLNARRVEFREIWSPEVLEDVAVKAGADREAYLRDYNDPSILDKLEDDYSHAVDELNIFGTPTFVFQGSKPVYLKLASSDLGDNLQFFRDFLHIAVNRPDVWEIKRA